VRSPTRTLYLGLDACDLHLAKAFAADGGMPALAGLIDSAASVETVAPLGYFVGANWPTTIRGRPRHGTSSCARGWYGAARTSRPGPARS
jgi:hypothetical protein